jgi:monoamine oxidase
MAKSDLLRSIQRAIAQFQRAQAQHIPFDEWQDQHREQTTTRRSFLRGSAALVGAIATEPWTKLPLPSSKQTSIAPVLIVGAGIAGLTAAYRLTQAGVPVHVVEASDLVGGRMKSLPRALNTPMTVELGGEFIDTQHTCLLNLVQELGLTVSDIAAIQAKLPEVLFFAGKSVSIDTLLEEWGAIAPRLNRDRKAIASSPLGTALDASLQAIDQTSIMEYLESLDTPDTLKSLLEVAYTTEFGLDASEQSALNLLYMLGTNLDTIAVYGDSDERFNVNGGNDQVPKVLATKLSDVLETGMVLEALEEQPDGRYRVTLQSGLQTLERTYDRVVLALPFSVLRQVALRVDLPTVQRLAIDTLGYGANAKLITSYREKLWGTRYHCTAKVLSDLEFQCVWESAESLRTPGNVGLLTNFTGGKAGIAIGEGAIASHVKRLTDQLDQVFPGIREVQIPQKALRAIWLTNPYSGGSYSCYRPGQWSQFRGREGDRVGNLFFIGEHTSLRFQGMMEGACASGEQVATTILQELNL